MLPAFFKGLILDMDGVLWRDNTPIGDLRRIFRTIREKGFTYVFATNNSLRTPEQYVQKLTGFGIPVEPRQVLTSSLVAADILSKTIPEGQNVFVIGGDGVTLAIKDKGFTILPLGKAQDASAVIMGVDPDINFSKMSEAALLVGRGVPFIATNPDRTFPTPRGIIPGSGAWVSVITTATGVQPIYAGKPSPNIFEMALKRLGTKKNETLIVGDRIETDIVGGQAGGFPCGLVLSGISTREEAEIWMPKIDFIAKDLEDLIS